MIQKILLWSYVFLGIGAFCYWIAVVLSLFRMLANRKPDRSLLRIVAAGLFSGDNFTAEGNFERRNLWFSIVKLCATLIGMVIVVKLGIMSQAGAAPPL